MTEIRNRDHAEQIIDAHYGYDGDLEALTDTEVIEEARRQLREHDSFMVAHDPEADALRGWTAAAATAARNN